MKFHAKFGILKLHWEQLEQSHQIFWPALNLFIRSLMGKKSDTVVIRITYHLLLSTGLIFLPLDDSLRNIVHTGCILGTQSTSSTVGNPLYSVLCCCM